MQNPTGTSAPGVDELNAHRGPMNEHLGVEILEASPSRCVARMPVEPNTQPYGILHGGASVALAATLGSTGSALHAASLGRLALGVGISATHQRSVRSGWVTGTATALSLGGTIASYEVAVTDEAGHRICTARLTCLLRDAPSGS